MSILKFAEDLTRLIILYTKTPVFMNNNSSDASNPLTSEQIVFATRHVLNTFEMKGFDDVITKKEVSNNTLENINNGNLLELSNVNLLNLSSENASSERGEASDTTVECKSNSENRSQTDKLVSIDDSFVSDTSQNTKAEQENIFFSLPNDNVFGSLPNPVICINNFNRSDTFVREEKQRNEVNQDAFENSTNVENLSNKLFLSSVNEIRKCISDIIAKINNLELSFLHSTAWQNKGTTQVSKWPLKNISASSYRTSTTSKKIPINIRKSNSTSIANGTSNMLGIQSENVIKRRKSTGGIEINNTPVKKFCESKADHSNTTLSSIKTVSPIASPTFKPKIAKNPKYAHIQSTIPKPINAKKKQL
ncbi:hypothetical protein PUN28_008542 [Cardiocondyla obscurior]|uniref:Uncharacterized protein n=1 Tax=Cardiocondyla obscurior TaxID=286306 RepID=A0AAW2G467_9HYME